MACPRLVACPRLRCKLWSSWILLGLFGVSVAACGGDKPSAAAPDGARGDESAPAAEADAPAAVEAEGEAEAEGGLPTKCHKGSDPCVPPPKFVQGLCSDTFSAVALHMFAPSAPWSKAYLKGKVKAWNASGGVSDNEAWLEFDEEV